MKRLLAAAIIAFCMLFAATAAAHKPSDSYVTLTVDGATIHGRWDIALRDLSFIMDVDGNGDGKVTWGEVRMVGPQIAAYASSRLTIEGCPFVGAAPGAPGIPPPTAVAAHSDGTYAVLQFEAKCAAPPTSLTVDYHLFFDVDAQHRGILHVEAGASHTHVFNAREPRTTFVLGERQALRQFRSILVEGIFHIWTGYDHILFLIALLLPAVLRREGKTWKPVADLKTALLDVLRIVTSFTLAHSITLSLAALGVVTLPSRLIESGIAASVVLAAANNLHPILREDRWVAAFLLGLMHGFGFSAALQDMDLPRSNLVLTLFGFNLGVEVGQLAIVAAFVPLSFAIRRTKAYRVGVLGAGSVLIFILASIWLIERAFAVKIIR